jgi:outer membrane protein assembly factor BamB
MTVLESLARESRRLRTLAVVLAVVGAGIAGAVVSLTTEEERRPAATGREVLPPLDEIELAWTANIERRTFPGAAVVQAGDVLVVSTDQGLYAYAKDCGTGGGACSPLWVGDIRPTDPVPGAADGVVYEATEQGLFAFAVDCGSGGATCEPLWVGSVPADVNVALEPVVADGVVKINYTFGQGEQHRVHAVAFPVGCGTDGEACEPLWTALVGKGTAYFPAPAVAGRFFQQVGSALVGFDAHCGSGGERCRPSFLWPTGGEEIRGPVRGGGELLVASEKGSVYAFPLECLELPCRPLWRGNTGGYLGTPPVVAAEKVFVSRGSTIYAFPLGCRSDAGECAPAWTATVEGVASAPVAYADDRVVIAASPFRGPGPIWAFPSDCENPCRPLWMASVDERVEPVEVVGGTVFAGTYTGEVLAYPAECAMDGSECPASWSAQVQGRITDILVDDSGIYVMSWGGGGLPVRQGTLTAFRG